MLIENPSFIWVILAFFVVAALYAAVGFGGGSSYLAILTLVFTAFFTIRSVALLCNLIVVSSSCYLYMRKGHFNFRRFLPFVLMSVPLAFIGALFRLSEAIFFILLGCTLIASSIALVIQTYSGSGMKINLQRYPNWLGYILGAGIGLLSGLVGIGGGIFLSPVLNHMRWDVPVKIAALASFFILVNSIAGITGLLVNDTFDVPWRQASGLLVAVFLGGQIGLRLSLNRFSAQSIRLLTAVLVFLVGIRVLVTNGFQLTFF